MARVGTRDRFESREHGGEHGLGPAVAPVTLGEPQRKAPGRVGDRWPDAAVGSQSVCRGEDKCADRRTDDVATRRCKARVAGDRKAGKPAVPAFAGDGYS